MKHHPFEQYFQQNHMDLPEESTFVQKERPSKKEIDIFCRELLIDNPELKEKIIQQMDNLDIQDLSMPIVHITSKAIKKDNEILNTGFVESIGDKGFRKRDTNVGAFIERGWGETSIAKPDFFKSNPEKFIKSLRLFIQRYVHHGLRTNKQVLGELRDSESAIPVMILIDGNVKLEHGSDYDDHYRLKEDATPEQIIGIIDLSEYRQSKSKEDIVYIAEKLLALLATHYSEQQKEVA